jgi:hypothetical protein
VRTVKLVGRCGGEGICQLLARIGSGPVDCSSGCWLRATRCSWLRICAMGSLVGSSGTRLHERLRWVDAVVCVLTSAYVASTWCTAEVAIAQSRGSRLIPVLTKSGVVHPLLSNISAY